MPDDNFYAPPSAPVTDVAADSKGLNFEVVAGKLHATSPVILPSTLCLTCGSHDEGAEKYEKKIYYAPKWILLTIFLNVFILIILHLVLRKKLEATYSLCRNCVAERSKRVWIATGVTVAALLGTILSGYLDSMPIFTLSGVTFVVALIATFYFANPSLRAVGHSQGTFTLKGASDEFIAELATCRPAEPMHW